MSNPGQLTQAQWMARLLAIARKPQGDAGSPQRLYTVRRGAIPWQVWDWPTAYAMEVKAPERDTVNEGVRWPAQTVLTINAAVRIPPPKEQPDIDDATLETLQEDAETIVAATVRSFTDVAVIASWFQGALEWSDQNLRIQGVRSTFVIQF